MGSAIHLSSVVLSLRSCGKQVQSCATDEGACAEQLTPRQVKHSGHFLSYFDKDIGQAFFHVSKCLAVRLLPVEQCSGCGAYFFPKIFLKHVDKQGELHYTEGHFCPECRKITHAALISRTETQLL